MAIDGDMSTHSFTAYNIRGWWQAELRREAKIGKIKLYLAPYEHKHNRYSTMKVETRLLAKFHDCSTIFTAFMDFCRISGFTVNLA